MTTVPSEVLTRLSALQGLVAVLDIEPLPDAVQVLAARLEELDADTTREQLILALISLHGIQRRVLGIPSTESGSYAAFCRSDE